MAESGYGLTIDESDQLVFTVKAQDTVSELRSKEKINDSKWHHLIAEADRSAKKLTIYIDGKRDSSGPGIGSASINNDSGLFVCGTPNGRCLKGTVEFIRISLGTLEDAKTNIEELYDWQFDGPFLRDFTSSKPKGKRDAGALELTY